MACRNESIVRTQRLINIEGKKKSDDGVLPCLHDLKGTTKYKYLCRAAA